MKVLKKTDTYTIYKKRSGRYAVEDALQNIVNGVDKINILIEAGIIKQATIKTIPDISEEAPALEEAPTEKAPAVEEAPAEEAPAEEAPAEEAPTEKAPAKKAPAVEEAPAEKAPAKKASAKKD